MLKAPTSRNSFGEWLTLAAGTFFVLAAWALPLAWWDKAPSLCLIHRLFGVHCPGCGMTRAFLYLLHFRIADAFSANWRVIIAAPILAGCFLRAAYGRAFALFSVARPRVLLRSRLRPHPFLLFRAPIRRPRCPARVTQRLLGNRTLRAAGRTSMVNGSRTW